MFGWGLIFAHTLFRRKPFGRTLYKTFLLFSRHWRLMHLRQSFLIVLVGPFNVLLLLPELLIYVINFLLPFSELTKVHPNQGINQRFIWLIHVAEIFFFETKRRVVVKVVVGLTVDEILAWGENGVVRFSNYLGLFGYDGNLRGLLEVLWVRKSWVHISETCLVIDAGVSVGFVVDDRNTFVLSIDFSS